MPLPALSAVIDELIGEGPDTLSDGESMIGLRRELARLEAVVATATARFDTNRTWEADGAQTAAPSTPATTDSGSPATPDPGRDSTGRV
jgi:hypothetical protein